MRREIVSFDHIPEGRRDPGRWYGGGAVCLALLLAGMATRAVFAITYVNVQDYGAVGDGTTDDRVPIQNALNTGQPVYFPKTAHFYRVGEGLVYQGPRLASDGATIRADATDFTLLTVSGVAGLYIGDLSLEYPTAQELTSGRNPLTLFTCSDFIVERVAARKGGAINIYHSTNGVVRECTALESSYNAFFVRSSSGVTLEDCYAETAVSAFAVEDARHVRILNCTAEDAYLGLRVEDSEYVRAEGNVLRYCRVGATAYGPRSASSIFTTDIVVRGNTFYHCYKTMTVNKVDAYVNHVGEYALATKMFVGDVTYDNNIVIGRDESTLLTDLTANVTFNAGAPLDTTAVYEDVTGTSYYTMVPYARYVYIGKNGGNLPLDWLFYLNFPAGVDLSQEDVLTMDLYWGATDMFEDTMAVNLYSGPDRTGFLCQIPLYNPYQYISLPTILYVPDGVDVSSVKCIDVERIGGAAGASLFTVSDIRKGLQSKVGYLHSYYHSEPADGAQNAVLQDNVFVDVQFPYLDRKRIAAIPPTISEGPGITGTTAQRPVAPPLGRRYYDTDLAGTVYWDGDNWVDVGTYLQGGKVNRAVHHDGTNPVDLRGDNTRGMDNYTIVCWIKPTDTGVGDRHLIEQFDIGAPSGFLLQLGSDNHLYGFQSVGGDFYAVQVHAPFPHDQELHHAALTFSYNGVISTTALYIDGQLVDTGSATGAPDHPAAGVALEAGSGFEGAIDGLHLYTRAMAADEIRQGYQRFAERLYAHWRFNEGAGSEAHDSSPEGSEGLASHRVGYLTSMDPVSSWVDGKMGTALDFNGAGYVDFGNEAWIRNVTNFTITAWVRPDKSGGADRFILDRSEADAARGYLLQLWTDDRLYGYQAVGGDFYAVLVHAAFPHDHAFHHVALTFSYDGTSSHTKLYIDGALVAYADAVGAPDAPAAGVPLTVGNGFQGVVDEVTFYTRALKPEEIQREFEWQTILAGTPTTGTVPHTSAEVADVMALRFDSIPGVLYELQYSTDLVSGLYTSTGAAVQGNGEELILYDPTGFSTPTTYRVVIRN